MKLIANNELLEIFNDILNRKLTLTQWSEIESCDEFQTDNFCGGFDATEMEFCFSYYDKNKTEYWFQKSMNEIKEIISRKVTEFEIRLAE